MSEITRILTAQQLHSEKVFQEFVNMGEKACKYTIQALTEAKNGWLFKMPGDVKFMLPGAKMAKSITTSAYNNYLMYVTRECLSGEYCCDAELFCEALDCIFAYRKTASELVQDRNIPQSLKMYDWLIRVQSEALQRPPKSKEQIEKEWQAHEQGRQEKQRHMEAMMETHQKAARERERVTVVLRDSAAYYARVLEKPHASFQERLTAYTSPVQTPPSAPVQTPSSVGKDILSQDVQTEQSQVQHKKIEQRTPEIAQREYEAEAILKKKLKDPFHATFSGTKENKTPKRY